jgi:hypothetical protein
MRMWKLICLPLSHLAKQLRMLFASVSVATGLKVSRRHALRIEAERLDRIRNPSKYLGKS